MCDPLEISLLHSFLTKYLLLWTKGYFLFRPQYELWSVFFMIFYQIWNTNYTLHFFLLGCHDNATILAGLCTHSRPSGNIKCYAKLKVFTRSGRAATSEWPRLWSFKIIKWLGATLHCATDYYTHLLSKEIFFNY